MALFLRVVVDICYVAPGTMPMGVSYAPIANEPGISNSSGTPVFGGSFPHAIPVAQTLRLMQGEQVPGVIGSETAANISTALTTAATDLASQIQAGSANMATVTGWTTGKP